MDGALFSAGKWEDWWQAYTRICSTAQKSAAPIRLQYSSEYALAAAACSCAYVTATSHVLEIKNIHNHYITWWSKSAYRLVTRPPVFQPKTRLRPSRISLTMYMLIHWFAPMHSAVHVARARTTNED